MAKPSEKLAVLGVFNSELTDEQLKAKASTLTFASIRASILG
jgi:hypothetical protein